MRHHREGRMPHALLLSGPRGVGKRLFAEAFIQARLCRHPRAQGTACGECDGCRQFLAGSHADYRSVGIEAKRRNILIDQLRQLTEWLSLTASSESGKHALIEPAERMTTGAANSLLKTLEEPPGNTVMVLISALPGRLPATVRSRSQVLELPRPTRDEALAWLLKQPLQETQATEADRAEALAMADGSPLAALSWLESGGLGRARESSGALLAVASGRESLVAAAERLSKQELTALLQWWRIWLEALIRRGQAGPGFSSPLLDDDNAELQKLLKAIDWKAAHELHQALDDAERRADSANPQLLIESLLGRWYAASRPTQRAKHSEARA